MRLLSISSGSSGNCIYVGNRDTHILVDAGIPLKRIEEGLDTIGLTPSDIDALFITHEHSDHISALGTVSKRYHIPIYATSGTYDELLNGKKSVNVEPDLFSEVRPDCSFSLKDLTVSPIRVSHDAADPVCYRFFDNTGETGTVGDRTSAAVCTDLGFYDDYIVDSLLGVNALLLEANHDTRMLEAGPYPYFLKRRISGEKGHLSNDSAGELLSALMKKNSLKSVLLGHLSKENNYAALAYETVRMQLSLTGIKGGAGEDDEVKIGIADRVKTGKIIEV